MTYQESNTAEEWRPVVGYEGLYEVSSHGRVRSLPRQGTPGRLLRQSPKKWGYLEVKLYRDSHQQKNISPHLLVAAAFLGPRPEGLETRHLDGDPTNNHVSNLCYGTKAENAQDRLRHGTHDQANKTHCPQGHPYDDANTRISINRDGSKHRFCLTCKREKIRAWRLRRRLHSVT